MKNNFARLATCSLGSLVGICTLGAIQPANALTFVLDFNEPEQENTTDNLQITVGTFDVTQYGFTDSDFDTITTSVLEKVESHYLDIPTVGENPNSPIPDGKKLDIDFEIGTIFTEPTNNDSDYYFVQIGDYISENNENINGISTGTLGIAAKSGARDENGNAPFGNGLAVGSVFTDHISNLVDPNNPNLAETTNAIAGTLSHEIGHALSLEHVYKEGAVTPNNVPPILGTGAFDLPSIDRLGNRAFSFSASGQPAADEPETNELQPVIDGLMGHGDELGDPFAPVADVPQNAPTLNNVAQLVGAVGTRDVTSASVPFEFSPGMGLLLIGGTWGVATLRQQSRFGKKD